VKNMAAAKTQRMYRSEGRERRKRKRDNVSKIMKKNKYSAKLMKSNVNDNVDDSIMTSG
jgi:hypothetical protein